MSPLLPQELLDAGEGMLVTKPRNPDVFNIREAAAFLGAREQTVHRLARRGAIPSFKMGKDRRFRRDALIRWTEEPQRGGGGRSVLIIDADEEVCCAMGKLLTGFGCRVQQAVGGKLPSGITAVNGNADRRAP